MHWASYLILAVVVVFYLLYKNSRQISPKVAQQYLQNGALLIDVRSIREFNSGHLPRAINLPLDEIETTLPRRVKDKDKVLLLHCQGGARSGAAQSRLKALGYANTFNLGSYARAAKIVGAN
jgi:phage shock protein E